MPNDAVAKKMMSIVWTYADKDAAALAEVKNRIGIAAKKEVLLRSSEFVKGLTFKLPQVFNSEPYYIKIWNWSERDKNILGDFLGHVSMDSYLEHGFMLSALVIDDKGDGPGEMFSDMIKMSGAVTDPSEDNIRAFWAEQVKKVFAHYKGR
ncbi:MAG: hypothetical protein OEV59_04745 [Deltaproteobacteria bacterium]|nr:hypothetical protein [Deltaproteobacteria bacterium]